MASLLQPSTVARLRRLRLSGRRRVEGRFAGAHASRRYGSSLDFADYREYVPGDDLRRIDVHAHARLGKRLIKLYDAEDEAALRVVVDLSASMRFGRKLDAAREVASALAVVATGGGDRVRLLLAGPTTDAGPWYRGAHATVAIDERLAGVTADGVADLPAALGQAIGDGPRGPVVLVSDLLFEGWDDTVEALGLGRADTCLVHVLGRSDVAPALDGDLRLADVETGEEVEVGLSAHAIDDYTAALERWLADVEHACGARGVAYARLVDDESLDDLMLARLPAAGFLG